MNYPQDLFINFNQIVKNRLGPYKIILKQPSRHNFYYKGIDLWQFTMDKAFDYSQIGYYGLTYAFKDRDDHNLGKKDCPAKIYLTTAAGDIEISEKDLKK